MRVRRGDASFLLLRAEFGHGIGYIDISSGVLQMIGIIGLGVVGKALYEYYNGRGNSLITYDIATDDFSRLADLDDICTTVFICVPTPYSREGHGLDCSVVYDAVSSLMGSKTVIIKSTLNPGTTDELQQKYEKHRFFYVPEFLSEDTAAEDYAWPDRSHVIGVPDGFYPAQNTCIAKIITLLPYVDAIGYTLVLARQAELLKLATNAFYAMKVTFVNQLYDIGMTQEAIDAWADNPWIGKQHTQVHHKNFRGYSGKCLPKDTMALADFARAWDPFRSLMGCTHRCNSQRLAMQGIDWEDFAGCKK